MADGIEGWNFFDVESGQTPDRAGPSLLPGGGRGRVVVLAATAFARREGWASRAAVLLAGEWAQEGLRVFLMDLGLDEPTLHEVLGLPNGEGVSDAFLFGASIQHIAKGALDNAIFFASAGAPPGDPEEVLSHPRWNDLAGGFSEADATLLLFLPTEIKGASEILTRATDVLFLAARGESAEAHLGPASIKMVTTLGPLGKPDGGSGESGELDEDAPPLEGVELGIDIPEDAGAGMLDDLDGSLGTVDFGLEGGIELAEGFGTDDPPEAGVEEEAETAQELLDEPREAPSADPEAFDLPPEDLPPDGPSPVHPEKPDGGEFQAEVGTAPDPGFGDDLEMGAGIVDLGEVETVETSADSDEKPMAPDFRADFIDLPPADGLIPASPPLGEFAGDLVQGPDFGAPVPPPLEVPETAPAPPA